MRYLSKTELIPVHWNTEQAEAVFEFLHEIAALIWERYECELIDSMQLTRTVLDEQQHQHDNEEGIPDDIPW